MYIHEACLQTINCIWCKHVVLKDTKGVIRMRKSKKRTNNAIAKRKGQTGKQWSTKHYTQKKRSSNTNPTNIDGKLRCSGSVSSSCSTCGKVLFIMSCRSYVQGTSDCTCYGHSFTYSSSSLVFDSSHATIHQRHAAEKWLGLIAISQDQIHDSVRIRFRIWFFCWVQCEE